MQKTTKPGINPKALDIIEEHYTSEEQIIIKKLSREWYVTNAGHPIKLGPVSFYKYILIKFPFNYQELFNLDREIVVIFSGYPNFEPRTTDAIEYIINKHPSLRLEKICCIILSKDNEIEKRIAELLQKSTEGQVLIPFSYDELLQPYNDYFLRNRLKNYFYSRDLFAFEAPLKKETYFFGRKDVIQTIVNRYKSHENAGLFGLRRTGKTSVVYGIERTLNKQDGKSVIIDCQTTAVSKRRWNELLYYIILEAQKQLNINLIIEPEEKYTEKNAAIVFEDELTKIYNYIGKKNLLIIFDEIERITFNISFIEHWSNELDFVFFWQTIRSLFQKMDIFSFLLIGTNPMCIEKPTIQGKDNPLFNQVPFDYMPGFDHDQTRDMVRTLGRLMGLKFSENLYGKLTDDFGGHPFLIRHICSEIHKMSPKERPVDVNKVIYDQAKRSFVQKYSSHIKMILEVLEEFYGDEYNMLEYLARGDVKTFDELANEFSELVNHLMGYGIIERLSGTYVFKIEAVRDYLEHQQKYQKLNQTEEEKWAEISERRNKLEVSLRLLIQRQLKVRFGKVEAKKLVLDALFDEAQKSKYTPLSYEELFDPNISKIYFDGLKKIITQNWEVFKFIFPPSVEEFKKRMTQVNKSRSDAHGAAITREKMSEFRECISVLEQQIEDFI